MSRLNELLEKRKARKGDPVREQLESLGKQMQGAQTTIVMDKQFLQTMVKEVRETGDILDQAIVQMQESDEKRDDSLAAVKKSLDESFTGLGQKIQDADTRKDIMTLSKDIQGLIGQLQQSAKDSQELLKKSLTQGQETTNMMAKQMETFSKAVSAQTSVIEDLATTMKTPKILVMDDDGNPIGVRHEF